ncbi:Rrf2 family transcriptional regulator [Paenibacillus nasutitermitis]|uniref:Rrf2 family transcriptional regulator n=1 Tax=Paenibacillus nasutitermitis TaxID=1652958 RepID=A0A916Z6H8_9BACL|nr:Rrf2 family transcriptional regulator [Paenibacillus nasutitermitis]GGD78932.1 Rrf2 family transcriptional regulator [Paenibacillus nasutitermitis]
MTVVSRYTIALHSLTFIALMTKERDEFVISDRIAISVNTSPVFIRRILRMLAKANLVIVQQGGKGAGWKLAKDPEEITLLDVYEAIVEKPLFELHHSPPNPNCQIGKSIQPALNHIYSNTESTMKQQLRRTTVSDLLDETISK